MRHNRYISLLLFAVLAATFASDGVHSQMFTPDMRILTLLFTDELVDACSAEFPEKAPDFGKAFTAMKQRNSAYVSEKDWSRIRRENSAKRKSSARIGQDQCSMVLQALSQGDEIDRHILKNFRRIPDSQDAP